MHESGNNIAAAFSLLYFTFPPNIIDQAFVAQINQHQPSGMYLSTYFVLQDNVILAIAVKNLSRGGYGIEMCGT